MERQFHEYIGLVASDRCSGQYVAGEVMEVSDDLAE